MFIPYFDIFFRLQIILLHKVIHIIHIFSPQVMWKPKGLLPKKGCFLLKTLVL